MQDTLRSLRNAPSFRARSFFTTPVRALALLLALMLIAGIPRASAQDVILQGFYWNSHPGDLSNTTDGGIWWDSIALVAPQIGAAGFQTVWTPPPTKGFAGKFDMGYGPYDYYDLGEFASKGTVRTRHGSRGELDAMIAALHGQGVNVMVDAVLNHRAGGDATAQEEAGPDTRFLVFNPPSGRLPGDPGDFHPNDFHADEDPPYHDPIFFEDVCYFNNPTNVPPTNGDGTPGSWYFGAPASIGEMGVDLIGWARFLRDVGFDELRLDAVKHIEPDYLAKFIIEAENGPQVFALGEFFDFNAGAIGNYHSLVENSGNTGGVKSANLAMFDFPLRGTLQAILNDGSGGQDLFQSLGGAGLLWSGTLAAEDVVTWLDTHDTDRTGFVEAGPDEDCQFPFGDSCLKFETEPDHNPVFQDKEDMGYPVLMAAEGRPMVFWKDYFWFGLDDDIEWLMNLRAATATGGSEHIQNLGGFWPQSAPYDGDNNGGNMFAMVRWGTSNGQTDGLVLGLNDHPSKTNAVFVNTPFANKYLKDYSDGFLFHTTRAFGEGRALVKAAPRDYTWYAPTGLYPQAPNATGSHFSLDATPGGCPHFVALRVGDAANYLVNGSPIAPGDEVAVKNAAGQVVGIGRIGQGFQWDGTHDMIIEVLGTDAGDGLANGAALRLFVYDASTGQELEAGALNFLAAGTAFDFSPDRPASPNRNGNFATFSVTATAGSTFVCEGIGALTGFSTVACAVTSIEAGEQFSCDPSNNTYDQAVVVTYLNPGSATTLTVNGQTFPLTGSPQTVILAGLPADGLAVNVTADLGDGCSLTAPAVFTAPPTCDEPLVCGAISQASAGSYDDGWQNGDNDGSGFGPWILFTQNNNGNTGGHFVFTSTNNGDGDSNGDGDIDSAGEAWGLYANSGDVSNAVRPFSDPLAVGGQFSLAVDNGWIESGGTVGFGLQNASGQNRFELFYRNGAATYEYVDAGGLQSIPGLFFTDEGLTVEFELTGIDTYTATVTRLDGNSVFTFSGTLAFADAGPVIDRVRLFNANAGGGGQRNAYFNKLELCAPPPPCAITALAAGNQTACDPATNGYTQEVIVTYDNAPAIGQLIVNGRSFPITGSPQTVALTGLDADGQAVDVTAFFSAEPDCQRTESGVFTAPEACPPCVIQDLVALAQTDCQSADNTYTQEVQVIYDSAPTTGSLIVNGQSFPIEGSPQTVLLTGLDADGQPVDVTASFSDDTDCTRTEAALFGAPAPCPPCAINSIEVGDQSACLPLTNTFTQTLTISYANAPVTGFLSVNGQLFNITGSPQTVTLAGLAADGTGQDVTAFFTSETGCSRTASNLFTAPSGCQAPTFCEGDAAAAATYDDGWQSGDNGGTGLAPWVLNSQGNAGHFVFSSTDNGNGDNNGDGDIDTGGEAFGFFANSGGLSEAVRPFDRPLTTNSQLNFGFDNGFIDRGGTVGFGLQNAAGGNLLEVFFIGGRATYFVNDANGSSPTGIGFTDEGLTISITLRSSTSYELRITRLDGGFTQTFTGNLIDPGNGMAPERIRFFNFNAGFNAPANLFVNGPEICRLFCELTLTEVQPSCPASSTGAVSATSSSTAFPITYTLAGTTETVSSANYTATGLAPGDYVLGATDANGCTTTLAFSITAEDDQAPTITCPADISVDNAPGDCAAVVSFAATATDNCGVTIDYSQNPGTIFPVGTTTVTALATDAAGNFEECAFSITVVDAEAPVPNASLTFLDDDNEGEGAEKGDYLVGCDATDNCPGALAPNSVIEIPNLVDPEVKYKVGSKKKLKIKLDKGEVEVEGPDPQAFWAELLAAGGVAVTGGQVVELKDNQNYEFKFDDAGTLEEVKGPIITLRCTATDVAGNSASDTDSVIFEVKQAAKTFRTEANLAPGAGFGLYPNPANQNVFLDLRDFADEPVEITVHNYLGAVVYRQRLPAAPADAWILDIADRRFAGGVYLVTVLHDGERYTQRLVIAR